MEETPPIVEDLALGAFRLVKQSLEIELDFAAETLPILDHYLASLDRGDDGRPDEKLVRVAGPCAGAYFGEVARRTLAGLEWTLPEEGHEYTAWRLHAPDVGLSLNPIGAALEAVFTESLGEWHAHLALPEKRRALVEKRLEATGPVRADDYYRLAIRYEVLEQALAVLRRG